MLRLMNKLPESFVYIDCVSTKKCVTRRFSTVKSWFQNRLTYCVMALLHVVHVEC